MYDTPDAVTRLMILHNQRAHARLCPADIFSFARSLAFFLALLYLPAFFPELAKPASSVARRSAASCGLGEECVGVHVRACVRARVGVCVRACVGACVGVLVRGRACVRVRACARGCVRAWVRAWVRL
jgi:hypothetical protein